MVQSNRRISVQAPAKINLFLRVLGRRADGYHDLETWMQKIDLYDQSSIWNCIPAMVIEFSSDDSSIPTDADQSCGSGGQGFFAGE